MATDKQVQDAKSAFLDQFAKNLNDTYSKGKSSVHILRPGEAPQLERLHTGVPSLDVRLGGGIPRGKMIEVWGPESSGKSTLAYQIIAEQHKRHPGSYAVLMDFEGSFDEVRAKRMGIDTDRVFPIESDEGGEAAFDVLRKLLEEGPRTEDGRGVVDLVVVDSIAAIIPQSQFDGDIQDTTVGVLARMMSKSLAMLTAAGKKSKTTFIWINQTRMKIGVLYGSPETTPGGESMKYYAFARIRTGRGGVVKEGDEEVAIIAKVDVKKNKISGRKGATEVKITPQYGCDFGYDIAQMGQKIGLVERKGSIYEMTEPVAIKAQGKDNFIDAVNAVDAETRMKIYDFFVDHALAEPISDEEDTVDPQLDGIAADAEEEAPAA